MHLHSFSSCLEYVPWKHCKGCIVGNGGAAPTNTTKNQPMKNLIVIIAAILAVGITGCAHKKAPACADGKSCCAKKR